MTDTPRLIDPRHLMPTWADHSRLGYCDDCPKADGYDDPAWVCLFVGVDEDGQVERVECERGHPLDLEDGDNRERFQMFVEAQAAKLGFDPSEGSCPKCGGREVDRFERCIGCALEQREWSLARQYE